MDKLIQEKSSKRDLVGAIACVTLSAVGPVVALLWGMQSGNSYDYFIFLRFVVFLGAFVFFALFSGQKRDGFRAVFVGIAILFNPFFPVYLTRDTWLKLDLLTIGVFVVGFGFWLVGFLRNCDSTTQ